jgi:hypothetical protein
MIARHHAGSRPRLDPAEWEYHVRRDDRTWLSRPERVEGEPPANAPAFSAIIADSWSFDDPSSAERAARSHGAEPGTFRVIPAPCDPGAWLAKSSPEAMAKRTAEIRSEREASLGQTP